MTSAVQRFERLILAGAVHVDDIAQSHQALVPRASNPVSWTCHLGGVAANAALAAARTGIEFQRIELCAATGTDTLAEQIESALQRAGIHPRLRRITGCVTGRYSAVLDADGELYIGLSAVTLAESLDAADVALEALDSIRAAVLMDANLAAPCLQALSTVARQGGHRQCAMSVSPAKACRLLPIAAELDLLFCNRREAIALLDSNPSLHTGLQQLADGLLERGFRQFVLTDASAPLIVQSTHKREEVPVPLVHHTHGVNGAGDALAGATFAAWCSGLPLHDAVCEYGLAQAAHIVRGSLKAPPLS